MINEIIKFLLNPVGIAVLIGFAFTCMFVFVWFRFIIICLSFLVLPLWKLIPYSIFIFFCIINLKFKRILELKNINISLLWVAELIGVYYIKDGKKYKKNATIFSFFKEMTQELNDRDTQIFENVYIICSILVSLVLVYYQYGLNTIIPHTFFDILFWITIYFVYNASLIFALERKKEQFLNLLLEINQYESH